MNVPTDLKSPGVTPTSELRAAYNELKQFLTLRTRDELSSLDQQSASQQISGTPARQPTTVIEKIGKNLFDELSGNDRNKSTAISTLLSPDGAFFTTDLFNRDLITQIGLTPDGVLGGDINVYGAKDMTVAVNGKTISYSDNLTLRNKLGLTPDVTEVADLQKYNERSLQNDALIEESKKLREERKSLYVDGLPVTGSEARVDEINTRLDVIQETIGTNFDRMWVFNQSRSEKTDLLYTAINSTPDVADAPNYPQVSLYRHTNRYLDPSSSASDYCNVFFNAIDSINMSLCVPFFRLNIVDRFSKKKGRYSKLSLAAFLKQSQDYDNDRIFYNSEPVLFGAPTQIAKKLKSGKVVGLETFYAPQTLLPDPTEVLSNPRRLDTSVPLLSLNSFNVSIESVGIALMSKKTADLSITLHDRSRLPDISPLVSVGNFSSLYFEIEWGWIHPHAAPEFNNPVARYLNALRFREVFSPVTYNMSMQDGGAMTINLRLMGGASVDAVNGSILNGGFVTRSLASDLLNKLIKADIEATEGRERATVDIKPVTTLLIDKSRTGYLIDRKFTDLIWEYAKKDDTSEEDRKALIEKLVTILNYVRYYKNEEIFEELKKILYRVNIKGFENAFQKINDKRYSISKEDYTSVAAYLTLFVGMPLAATGLYDEVQIHTFKFNKEAGDLAESQICDAPIKLVDVIKRSDMPGSLGENSSINNALLLLGNYLNNPKQPQYGIATQNQYDAIKVDPVKPSGDPADKPVKKASKPEEDEFKITPGFTTPNIRYIVRSVPAKVFTDKSTSLADYQIDPNRLIAQVIVYDSNASPNFDLIVKAYEYGKVKGTNLTNQAIPTSGITADEAKATFKRIAPSITYGATNSVLRSVSVSTDINPVIAQQQILEIGKDLFLGGVKADESSDVNEVKLFPGSVTVNMLGLPIIERGQEVYLDLGTGTTLDSLYYVTSVKHDFKPGDFTTSLNLVYKGQGSVSSLTTMIENYNKTFEKPKQAEVKKAEPATSAPTKSSIDPLQARREYEDAVKNMQ